MDNSMNIPEGFEIVASLQSGLDLAAAERLTGAVLRVGSDFFLIDFDFVTQTQKVVGPLEQEAAFFVPGRLGTRVEAHLATSEQYQLWAKTQP